MRGYFVGPIHGNYYEGDRAHALDIEVPQRPSGDHVWSLESGAWVLDPSRVQSRLRRERDEQEREAARRNNAMRQLLDASPAEIDAWVDSSFPTLTATEKNRLAVIVKMLAITARSTFR